MTRTAKDRALTTGEIALVRSVFADSIDTENVRIKTAWWVLPNYAVSPNGNVYFHKNNWVSDFSSMPLATQAWFIHEMTHVWQVQQGMKVVRKAIFDRRYAYILEHGKSFFQYGIEQQASMVEHYFIKKQQGLPCDNLKDCIPFL